MRTAIGSAILAATALLSFDSAFADDEGLPANRVIAAIEAAVTEHPGLVKEVEVEREGDRLIVEVEIVGEDGRKAKIKIDPDKNVRIR